MGLVGATFLVCVVSALLPLVNAEAYLGAAATQVSSAAAVWLLATWAAAGQMVGKAAWFLAGRRALDWAWLRRRTAGPRWQARLDLWQRRTQERPVWGSVLMLASATVGFPPFAVMSFLAGRLGFPFAWFLVVGFLGRLLRFAAVLGGAGVLLHRLAG